MPSLIRITATILLTLGGIALIPAIGSGYYGYPVSMIIFGYGLMRHSTLTTAPKRIDWWSLLLVFAGAGFGIFGIYQEFMRPQ